MADDLQQSLERFRSKARLLAERYATLAAQKAKTEELVAQLQATVDAQRGRIEQLTQQVEYLRIASTITPTRDDIAITQATLTKLVREIDNCINDLTD
ncbi:MAG: hypothetical protein K2L81_07335 [Muribaculaceae bacterium]|nr:hypothetical protein [Muribaculaceae bacterium]